MKKQAIIFFCVASTAGFVSCDNVDRSPGHVYMPDMTYSRAYETFLQRDSLKFTTDYRHSDDKIFYNALPVGGTVARGEEMPFNIPKDAGTDTTNYVASKSYVNPMPDLDTVQMKEAERLFLINCAICHGPKLDGNGPLYKGGNGPYPAAPANLAGVAKYIEMPEGQMYYSVTYGKNLMGSYASQLSRKQRWMVIDYIKSKQKKAAAGSTDSTSATASAATATTLAK